MTDIFVFGSNLAGRHGAGSALEAVRNHGAVYGQGRGPQGNSYALPTKSYDLQVLSLPYIHGEIATFLNYAKQHPKHTFNVVAIGCGLAGYSPAQIGPLFRNAPPNVKLPPEFAPYATR